MAKPLNKLLGLEDALAWCTAQANRYAEPVPYVIGDLKEPGLRIALHLKQAQQSALFDAHVMIAEHLRQMIALNKETSK